MSTIASIIKAGIAAGNTNEEILVEVYKAFPNANTKSASVAWYRSQMKKAGDVKPPKVKASTKTVKKAVPTPPEDKAFAKAMDAITSVPHYYVKNIKTVHGGLEGDGYQATLYRGGARIATVTDQGNGGCLHWQWLGSPEKAVVKTRDFKGDPLEYMGNSEEALLAAYVMTLPDYDEELQMDVDLYMEELVNNEHLLKQYRSLTRGKIAYISAKGALYTMRVEPTPENLKQFKMAKTNEGAILLNALDELEALAHLKKLQR